MAMFALAAVTLAGGVATAVQQRNAGIIQNQQYQQAAKAEGDAARGREIERRRTLIKTLAARNAYAGATGQTTGGSIATLNTKDINDASNDLLYDKGSSQAKIRAYSSAGANAQQAGNTAAIGTVFDTAAKMYKLS